MKIMFIESRIKNRDIRLTEDQLNSLPKEIFIAYSIQYRELAESIKSQLKNKVSVKGFSQVLGCSKINTKFPVLLIGQGRFHAINLYLQAPQVYIFENGSLLKMPSSEINKLKTARKTALIKFLSSDNLGILVSTKPGQEHLSLAIKLKEKLTKKGKNCYIFLSDNIDFNQFENFNIGSFVNTACTGLAFDNPSIINISELPKPYAL
ncbi:MAG: diphthamide synthesis protein [Candidatus Nanoarchaeia archaeon]